MKKSTSPHKKRTAAKRKKRSKQHKRASLQQRLARLAKTQKSFASLNSALNKAPPSALGSVEPEPEGRRRPRLGKPLLTSTINSQDLPHYFGLQQPSVQQPLSVKFNTSTPQQLIGPRQVESTVVHSASVPLWEALPRQRHDWPLPSRGVPLPEFTPLVLTHAGGPNLSLLSDYYLSTAGLPTFAVSTSTFLEHPPTEFFHQDIPHWPRSPCQSFDYPNWKGSYQPNLAAMPVNPNNHDLLAGNPPEAELLPSKDKKKSKEPEIFVFEEYLQETTSLSQANKHLIKTRASTRKRKDFRRTKNWQHCLGKPRSGYKSRAANASNRSTGHEISTPREPLPESVRSTQASDYYPSILNGLVYGDIPVPKDISSADLDDFIQQLVQKMAALASPLGLGDGCHDHQSRSDAPASSYAAPCFPTTSRPVHAG